MGDWRSIVALWLSGLNENQWAVLRVLAKKLDFYEEQQERFKHKQTARYGSEEMTMKTGTRTGLALAHGDAHDDSSFGGRGQQREGRRVAPGRVGQA